MYRAKRKGRIRGARLLLSAADLRERSLRERLS